MPSRFEEGSLVTVFGGSGFVGRHAVRALARGGWRVRAAVRRPDLAGHLQPMGRVGQIHGVQANLRYPDSVRAAVEGAQAVVNLVGILARSGRQTFDAVHVAGARAAARAAREAGVKTFVHVSALGADRRSAARYARTKAAGEEAVLAEFPGAVILRPSLVFGPEDQLFNRFAAMARYSPFLPLIGGGKTRFQPVYVVDVAEAIAAACAGKVRGGTIYELGGPEVVTFRQLLDNVQKWSGRKRRYLWLPVLARQARRAGDAAVAQFDAAADRRPGAPAAAAQCRERGRAEGRPHARRLRHRQAAYHGHHRAGLSGALPAARPVRALSGMRFWGWRPKPAAADELRSKEAPMKLELAQRIISGALAHARAQKFKPLAVAVLDARGALKAFAAEDGTSLKRRGDRHRQGARVRSPWGSARVRSARWQPSGRTSSRR